MLGSNCTCYYEWRKTQQNEVNWKGYGEGEHSKILIIIKEGKKESGTLQWNKRKKTVTIRENETK